MAMLILVRAPSQVWGQEDKKEHMKRMFDLTTRMNALARITLVGGCLGRGRCVLRCMPGIGWQAATVWSRAPAPPLVSLLP